MTSTILQNIYQFFTSDDKLAKSHEGGTIAAFTLGCLFRGVVAHVAGRLALAFIEFVGRLKLPFAGNA